MRPAPTALSSIVKSTLLQRRSRVARRVRPWPTYPPVGCLAISANGFRQLLISCVGTTELLKRLTKSNCCRDIGLDDIASAFDVRRLVRIRGIRATAPPSARSPASSHSMDLPAHGSPRPARRWARICWSAVLRLEARTQAFSNTSSSDRGLGRQQCKPFCSDKSGPEKDRSLPSSAAISSSLHLFLGA